MSDRGISLRERTQEINAEYWEVRETQTERVAVAQLTLALARAEGYPQSTTAALRKTRVPGAARVMPGWEEIL